MATGISFQGMFAVRNKATLILLIILSCNTQPHSEQTPERSMPRRSAEQVQDIHSKELMAIAGVVGTAVGKSEDGSPVILVFVEEVTEEIRQGVPANLEGYPVTIQVTGKIVPK